MFQGTDSISYLNFLNSLLGKVKAAVVAQQLDLVFSGLSVFYHHANFFQAMFLQYRMINHVEISCLSSEQ